MGRSAWEPSTGRGAGFIEATGKTARGLSWSTPRGQLRAYSHFSPVSPARGLEGPPPRHGAPMTIDSMTIATTPAPGALPAAGTGDPLTADDTARIAAALDAAYAETTRKVYAFAWSQWDSWCADRGDHHAPGRAGRCVRLPHRPRPPGRLPGHHQRRVLGHRAPAPQPRAARPDRPRRRPPGTSRTAPPPRHRAAPTRPAAERRRPAADHRPPSTPAPDRSASATPPSSCSATPARCAAPSWPHSPSPTSSTKPAGLLLHLRRSKTDPEARGQVVGIAHGQHPLTDPIAALDAWLALRGTTARTGVHQPARSATLAATDLRQPPSPTCCQGPRPRPPACPATGSPPTPCAPDTPPARPSPASPSNGSPPRPGTADLDVLIERYIRPVQALADHLQPRPRTLTTREKAPGNAGERTVIAPLRQSETCGRRLAELDARHADVQVDVQVAWPGTNRPVDVRLGEELTQQIRARLGQLLLKHPGRVDTGIDGHRDVLLRVGFERSLEGSRGGRRLLRRHAHRGAVHHSAGLNSKRPTAEGVST